MRNGFSKSKTIDMLLNACGKKAMKKQQSTCGINASKRAEKTSSVVTSSHVAAVKQLLDYDRRFTIRDIVAKTDYRYGTVSGIIHNQLNMRRICARWIPKMLNTDQKRLRVECCEQLLKRFEREGEKFMDRIVNVDETWISLYTPDQSSVDDVENPRIAIPKEIQNEPVHRTYVHGIIRCERDDLSPCSSPGTDSGCRILYEGELEYFTCYTRS